jgi:hypothetical protein
MNKRCGDDSCGGSCGACGGGEICATRDTGLHCTPMDPVAPTATLELCRP